MQLAITEAKTKLTDLVRRDRAAQIAAIRARAAAKTLPGPSARQSQDFLYDEDGLPE